MKLTPLLLIAMSLISCYKTALQPGRYSFGADRSYIQIDASNKYYFSTNHGAENLYAFSKGSLKIKGNIVYFLPDSSFFFHITVFKYSFDPSLKEKRKIVLNISDSVYKSFHFQFDKYSSDTGVKFNARSVVYKPSKMYNQGHLTLNAQLNDSVVLLPEPIHSLLKSNTIEFANINDDDPNDKPWNVLVLNVSLDRKMFFFTTLSPFVLGKNELIKKDWPIYVLDSKK